MSNTKKIAITITKLLRNFGKASFLDIAAATEINASYVLNSIDQNRELLIAHRGEIVGVIIPASEQKRIYRIREKDEYGAIVVFPYNPEISGMLQQTKGYTGVPETDGTLRFRMSLAELANYSNEYGEDEIGVLQHIWKP